MSRLEEPLVVVVVVVSALWSGTAVSVWYLRFNKVEKVYLARLTTGEM